MYGIFTAVIVSVLLWPAAVLADEALATAKLCTACHKLDAKLVGPAYKEVAAKYKGDDSAAATLAEKVRVGGSGVWGPIPMPPNPADKLTDEEIQTLIAWILSLE